MPTLPRTPKTSKEGQIFLKNLNYQEFVDSLNYNPSSKLQNFSGKLYNLVDAGEVFVCQGMSVDLLTDSLGLKPQG